MSGKNLSVSWVDFEKAFDRVPHSWIARCLETVQAPSIVIRGVGKAMSKWTTNLEIRNGEAGVESRQVRFRRGLYQGDSLSPESCGTLSCWGLIFEILDHEQGIPSKRKSAACVDYVPALCTHRPSLLPIEWLSEVSGFAPP